MKPNSAPKTPKKTAPRQSLFRILSNNLRLLAKVARLTPDYFVLVILEGIVWGLINSAEAVFTVRLFDAIDTGADFPEAMRVILLTAGFYLVAYAFDAWYNKYAVLFLQKKLSVRLHRELFEQAQRLDLSSYDDPDFYNDFVWAMDEAGTRAVLVLTDVGKLVNRLVASGTLFSLMLTIDLRITVALLAVSVVSVVVNQIGNRVSYAQEEEEKPQKREREYLNRVFHLADYAKEIRISRVSELLFRDLDRNTEASTATAVKYGKRHFVIYGLCYTLLANLVYYGVLFYTFSGLLSGALLVGAFAAAVGMVWRVRWMLEDLVERLSKLPKHSLFLEKYYGFLAYEPKITRGTLPVPPFESIELRNVSFTYDFSDKPRYAYRKEGEARPAESECPKEALHNVSFTLKAGERIAIVGYNGAGKTTLIKLLMRFYDPTEGVILLNGTDVRQFDPDAYRARIGTVFQDFRIFAATVGENVTGGAYDPETDEARVRSALDAAGFTEKLASLPLGPDTPLTREFDDHGTNLSGGEGQKVAIARVFARSADLIVMDEPSSALDPIAEHALNESILRYAAGKTVIFISHRLSTTRMADRIYMFASGELREVGSHEELMARNGQYAEMFRLQAEKYRGGGGDALTRSGHRNAEALVTVNA